MKFLVYSICPAYENSVIFGGGLQAAGQAIQYTL
jgi:hypothetical protein